MTRKSQESRDAKLLRKTYGCKHTTAVNLIREHGLDKATEIIAERAARGEYVNDGTDTGKQKEEKR